MQLPTHNFNFTSEELNNFLKMAGSVAIGVLTLFLLVKTINEIKTYSTIGENPLNSVQNVISVTGKSDMDVKPDITSFSWSVESDGKTIDAAQSKAATINNKAIEFVKSKGIKEADIKTLSLNTYPKYETTYKGCVVPKPADTGASSEGSIGSPMISVTSYNGAPCNSESVISGYTTSLSVQVKVRDINKNEKLVSELVGGLGSIGVKASTPTNTIDDIETFKRVVRNEAIIKARQEAEVLARALGVKLVRITSFNENSGGGYPYAMDYMSARPAMMEKSVAPELPTGTNNISSEVNITYQIK
ncbi:MAG: SIMPL domain-containing protein [Candidatus Pacebacteria bacterium]|jgi:uncharacterized protein YggE|nr:SIMPL domain-containing protein [Candidatus Paceibacterota bacterium]MBP9818456.1 SIMPL domain-containing protein [Candidatus Paceibacterota bacterium]